MATPKKSNARRSRRVLRLPAVIAKTGLGRSAIYEGDQQGWFPKRVKLAGGRASGWFEDEVDDYLEKLAAERASA